MKFLSQQAIVVIGIIMITSCSKKENLVIKAPAPAVEYQNTTQTPVYAVINGTPQTIPVLGTVKITGKAGDSITCTANTKGMYGETISWNNLSMKMPDTGTLYVPIYVDSSYFFLYFQNIGNQTFAKMHIYTNQPFQIIENIHMLPDSIVYGLGYYKALMPAGTDFFVNPETEAGNVLFMTSVTLENHKNQYIYGWAQ